MDYFRKTEKNNKINLKLRSKILSLEKDIFTISKDVQIDDKLHYELCPTFRSLKICNDTYHMKSLG